MYSLECSDPNNPWYNYYFKEIWGQNNKVLTREKTYAAKGSFEEMEQLQYKLNLERGYHWLMIVQIKNIN